MQQQQQTTTTIKSGAVTSTCMFLFGSLIGFLINTLLTYIEIHDTHEVLVFGILQVFLNAYIIQFVETRIENMGLFVLGLLSGQILVIRRLWHPPPPPPPQPEKSVN